MYPTSAPTAGRAFTPRFVREDTPRPRGVPHDTPELPNLRINIHGMRYPIGAVVAKTAFPNGFLGHLEMGAVTETTQPVTIQTALPPTPAPTAPVEALVENRQLRGEIATLEARVTILTHQLNENGAIIGQLRADLAFAQNALAAGAVAAAQPADPDGPLVPPSMGMVAETTGLAVKASPWAGEAVDSRPFESKV